MLREDSRKSAYEALDFARVVRERYRRKTAKGDPHRQQALKLALRRVKAAMKPVRREIHRTQYQAPSQYRLMILGLSKDLQSERRKLWKMLQPSARESEHEKTLLERVLDSR